MRYPECPEFFGIGLATDELLELNRRQPNVTLVKAEASAAAVGRNGIGIGIGMTAISAVDLAIWDATGKLLRQPGFKLPGGRTKSSFPVDASRLYAQPLDTLYAGAKAYAAQGFPAVKLRFGRGPNDGISGLQKTFDPVRTARAAIGPDVDLMAGCSMGSGMEYAGRMLRWRHSRWQALAASTLPTMHPVSG